MILSVRRTQKKNPRPRWDWTHSSCVPVITWLCSRVMRFQSRPTNWPLLSIESPVIVKKSSPKNLLADCRPTVGRLSADCRQTVGCLLADCQQTVGCLLANSRPTDSRQLVEGQPTVGQQVVDRRPTVGRQSANSRLTVGQQVLP